MKTKASQLIRSGSSSGIVALVATLIATSLLAGAAAPELPPLTSVSGNPRLPGKFIWADLVTDNPNAARKFYAGVFGWEFRGPGAYMIAFKDSRPIAGVIEKSRPANNPKAKPRWFGYLSVRDVQKAERAVVKEGGKVVAAPESFPKRGEQAVFTDPEGAMFGVLRSSAGDPEDFLAEPGEWVWMQLLSRDARKASDFYRTVGGYEVVENSEPGRLNDYILTSKGFARATVRTLAKSDYSASWLPYVRVKNVAETVNKVRELGGSVLVEPSPDRLQGKVAVIADPTGAAVGILEWVPQSKMGGG